MVERSQYGHVCVHAWPCSRMKALSPLASGGPVRQSVASCVCAHREPTKPGALPPLPLPSLPAPSLTRSRRAAIRFYFTGSPRNIPKPRHAGTVESTNCTHVINIKPPSEVGPGECNPPPTHKGPVLCWHTVSRYLRGHWSSAAAGLHLAGY